MTARWGASAPTYRHESHLSDAPTRGQIIGRRIVGTVVAVVAVVAFGLVGAADVDRECQDANLTTSSVCQP